MALDRPIHAPETAGGTTRSSVALHVAPGSAVHSGLAQAFTPPLPPRFSSPAHCRVAPFLFNRALHRCAAPRPDGAPNAAGEQARRLPIDFVDRLEERTSSSSRRPRASQYLCAFSSTRAGERCNVDSQVDQVLCDSRTAGSTARSMVARSPLLGAGTVPHPVLPTLPAISTERHPLPLQVRHAPSLAEWNRRRPIPPHKGEQR